MPVTLVQYTPVTPARGKYTGTHAATLQTPTETACGRSFRGWKVSLRELDCDDCKRAVGLQNQKPKRRRKVPR